MIFTKFHRILRRYKQCRKHFSSEAARSKIHETVRVRFAPSPTGYLHLGGLRTVIYNYLFARANRGTFVLRIEDTDRKRVVPDSVDNLINTLNWLELNPDEGVGSKNTNDGRFGPYFQSQRLHLYKQQADILVEQGKAYRCFCTEDRLMMLRNEALKNRQIVKYDSRCRHLKSEDVERKLNDGAPYVIRFKLDPKSSHFDDLIFKRVEFDNAVEGDFVLIKSDGYPTYHFANVVDDYFMRISHVLRGEEWLSSTRKHVPIYEAFGWQPPVFGHLPLILGLEGRKLSKRNDDAFVEYYKQKGYFPLALINSVTSTGKGFQDRDKDKVYDLNELASKFDISSVSRSPTRYEQEWLDVYNRTVMFERKTVQELIPEVRKIIDSRGLRSTSSSLTSFDITDEAYITRCIEYARNRVSTLHQLFEKDLACLWSVPDSACSCFLRRAGAQKALALSILNAVKKMVANYESEYPKTNFQTDAIAEALGHLCVANQWSKPFFLRCLRTAICGVDVGPPVAELFDLIGRHTVIERLQFVIDKCKEEHVDEPSLEENVKKQNNIQAMQ